MYYDPRDTEKYRENTHKNEPTYSNMKTKLCVSCRKLRSVAQYNSETSRICNQCKRRIK